MKAIIYTEYGDPDVLHLSEVPKPTPKDNEILVRVHATEVGFGDLMARKFNTITPRSFNMPSLFWLLARLEFGLSKPKKPILGSEFAGEVEAVGSAVTRFKPGDQVFGYPTSSFGAYAEYLCMAETASVMLKPANMTYEEATTVPYGALTALNLLKKVDIQPGQKVLINGASGSIGSAALQLAKSYGAHVTAVCGTPRLEYVKALGAGRVIDYTQEDFTRNGETYDVIFDILGKTSFARCKRSLKPNGRLLYASFKLRQLFQMLWTSIRGGKRVICALALSKQADLARIRELVEAGKIKAILDRCYPLEQAAEAHRYAESGQKRGNIVITA
ncbi:MAG: NAD(P)-dependent alcohol dehydrogenase [Anaerolineae bacterium]|nr:NAD(P)-dependent alcohol dehydrogenase [Anaerolineae bacterium]